MSEYFTVDDVAKSISSDYTCPKCGGKRKMVWDNDIRKETFVCEPCQQNVNEMFDDMFNKDDSLHGPVDSVGVRVAMAKASTVDILDKRYLTIKKQSHAVIDKFPQRTR